MAVDLRAARRPDFELAPLVPPDVDLVHAHVPLFRPPDRPWVWTYALLVLVGLAVALGVFPIIRRLMSRLEVLQRGVQRFGEGDLAARVQRPECCARHGIEEGDVGQAERDRAGASDKAGSSRLRASVGVKFSACRILRLSVFIAS